MYLTSVNFKLSGRIEKLCVCVKVNEGKKHGEKGKDKKSGRKVLCLKFQVLSVMKIPVGQVVRSPKAIDLPGN